MAQTVLLDGDVVVYRAVFSASENLVFGDEVQSRVNLQTAKELIDHEMVTLQENYSPRRIIVCLSHKGPDWRKQVMPSYKEHRKGPKPAGWSQVRDYVEDTYWCEIWPPLEADDILGILATCPGRVSGVMNRTPKGGIGPRDDRVIVSIDKDMQTIPCNWARTFEDEPVAISEVDAFRFFMKQTLMGDPTDGYPGIKGVGPVAADRILEGLEDPVDLWHAVVRAYEKKDMFEQDALDNARCAHILQWGDYDFKTKEPILWTP